MEETQNVKNFYLLGKKNSDKKEESDMDSSIASI